MKWTLSNQLTVSRVVMIPLFIFAFYFLPQPINHYVATLLFILASITDWLDGHLARTRGEVTAFGRFLDPVADKLLVTSALVLLIESGYVPSILGIVIIGREITIGALREWLAERSTIVHVSVIAKWKTAFQMAAIIALIFHIDLFGIPTHIVGLTILWIAVVLTLWSAYEYLRDAWPELKESNTGTEQSS